MAVVAELAEFFFWFGLDSRNKEILNPQMWHGSRPLSTSGGLEYLGLSPSFVWLALQKII